jgi:deoxyribodipyrimidine photolyase
MEFQEKRRNIAWKDTPEHLDAWKNGLTGYPLVDA